MTDRSETVSIPADNDGFMTLNCPFCGHSFKLRIDEFREEDVIALFCPHCGLQHVKNSFLSNAATEAIRIAGINVARQSINDAVEDFVRGFHGSKAIKVTPGNRLPLEPHKVISEVNDLKRFDLPCCARSLKITPLEQHSGIYCPYCGGNV